LPTPRAIDGMKNTPRLTIINDHGEKLFWKAFYAITNKYPEINQLLKEKFNFIKMHD